MPADLKLPKFVRTARSVDILETPIEYLKGVGPARAEVLRNEIRKADPLYEPAAYLNGTANPSSLKWLLATRAVFDKKVMGYVTPRFMELVQVFNHLFRGRYLSYAGPKSIAKGKLAAFFMGLVDRRMMGIFFNILKRSVSNPLSITEPAYLQSFMIIQPVNFEEDGRQDMCDSCPDITVHEGRLVWSCRMEELNDFGAFVQTVPRRKSVRAPGPS